MICVIHKLKRHVKSMAYEYVNNRVLGSRLLVARTLLNKYLLRIVNHTRRGTVIEDEVDEF